MLSRMPLEDTDGMSLNDTIKAGDDTALAGSEDCLHLAVFTPRVINNNIVYTTAVGLYSIEKFDKINLKS